MIHLSYDPIFGVAMVVLPHALVEKLTPKNEMGATTKPTRNRKWLQQPPMV